MLVNSKEYVDRDASARTWYGLGQGLYRRLPYQFLGVIDTCTFHVAVSLDTAQGEAFRLLQKHRSRLDTIKCIGQR